MSINYKSRIREYVNNLFENMPQTPTKEIFKEELLSDLLKKYNNLLANNMNEREAYNKVISSIKKQNYLSKEQSLQTVEEPYNKKKSALLTSIAVMMYILCPVSVIVFSYFAKEIIGIVIMFVLVAIATGLLIYNNMTKPKYMKHDEFVDEDFEHWDGIDHQTRRTIKSIESAMWAIIVVLYLAISFMTMAWHITWIIFIIGGALEKVIRAYFEYKEIK